MTPPSRRAYRHVRREPWVERSSTADNRDVSYWQRAPAPSDQDHCARASPRRFRRCRVAASSRPPMSTTPVAPLVSASSRCWRTRSRAARRQGHGHGQARSTSATSGSLVRIARRESPCERVQLPCGPVRDLGAGWRSASIRARWRLRPFSRVTVGYRRAKFTETRVDTDELARRADKTDVPQHAALCPAPRRSERLRIGFRSASTIRDSREGPLPSCALSRIE